MGLFLAGYAGCPGSMAEGKIFMIDMEKTAERLKDHLRMLTQTIGERSVLLPENLKKTQEYIETFYQGIGVPVHCEYYPYRNYTAANVVAEISFCDTPTKHYLVGAHYDSVAGTVGADDNASAIAVQLETARHLNALKGNQELDLSVKFVSFTLEEPPAFGTRHMGSRVDAMKDWKKKEHIDGMICLYVLFVSRPSLHTPCFPYAVKAWKQK
ncbi:MAG: M28 family peptidase, partial [Deltaproteobacteria bacterium]|nr:M28 family peptidase [Deltaproteobacteria bacterium]